ncbi:hypothetical protein EHS25_008871 [Saitozyma podzolica]|uniref:Charged multivesicular body protein 7 n=1 Tax=Saitozyma podzolica TaxID=1890683 RepID=A0A427YMZ7_9TREE|nr:hypothetical protein EHS25_008871 [Saitozyma podzolica]
MTTHPSSSAQPPSLPAFLLTTPPPVPPPSEPRLKALYASTASQRHSNPTGYAANVSWWSTVLRETLRSGWVNGDVAGHVQRDGADRLVLKVDEALVGKYEWDGRRPKGLGGVVETLATKSSPTLHPLSTFLASPTPLRAPPSITYRLVGRPLWWALGQLNPFGGEREVGEDECWKRFGKGREYVHMELLEQSASAFVSHLTSNPLLSYSSSLFNPTTFRETFGEAAFPGGNKGLPSGTHRLGEKDCEVLMKWLGRDVIKLLEPGENAAEHEITEADRGTLSIILTLDKLEKQIEDIESQLVSAQAKAKKHLAANQRSLAMSALRSKKALEEILDRRIGAAEQLRGVVRSIDQAKGDVEIMSAYSTSTTTLSHILRNPKLDAEYIASTTDALSEALADAHEIDEAVRIGGKIAVGAAGGGGELEEEELREELEGMVREEKERQAREEREERERQERQEREKREKEQKEQKEREEKEKEEQEKVGQLVNTAAASGKNESARREEVLVPPGGSSEDLWKHRYEDAQRREKEEKERAEVERMRRDERRAVAEGE